MKEILLPSQHLLFKHFPHMESEDISFIDFKEKVKTKLKDIHKESNEFLLQRNVISTEHINFRYPMMSPYYIKDVIRDKKILHIGSRGGELCEGMSHYAKKITSVEIDSDWNSIVNNRNYRCDFKYYNNDYRAVTELQYRSPDYTKYDIYYFWIAHQVDVGIWTHLYDNGHRGTYILGAPQQEDKFDEEMRNLSEFVNRTNSKIDYIPVLFDESINWHNKYDSSHTEPQQFPIDRQTIFTERNKDNDWDSIHTFCNQWGVMLLLKIIIGER